jgi:hypothetical protein
LLNNYDVAKKILITMIEMRIVVWMKTVGTLSSICVTDACKFDLKPVLVDFGSTWRDARTNPAVDNLRCNPVY